MRKKTEKIIPNRRPSASKKGTAAACVRDLAEGEAGPDREALVSGIDQRQRLWRAYTGTQSPNPKGKQLAALLRTLQRPGISRKERERGQRRAGELAHDLSSEFEFHLLRLHQRVTRDIEDARRIEADDLIHGEFTKSIEMGHFADALEALRAQIPMQWSLEPQTPPAAA